MVLLLVVPDEALFFGVKLVFPMLFSPGKNILTRIFFMFSFLSYT